MAVGGRQLGGGTALAGRAARALQGCPTSQPLGHSSTPVFAPAHSPGSSERAPWMGVRSVWSTGRVQLCLKLWGPSAERVHLLEGAGKAAARSAGCAPAHASRTQRCSRPATQQLALRALLGRPAPGSSSSSSSSGGSREAQTQTRRAHWVRTIVLTSACWAWRSRMQRV